MHQQGGILVKMKIVDRVLAAFSGLVILVIGVGLFVFGTGIFPFKLDLSFLEQQYEFWQRAVMTIVAVALCALGLRGIAMLFRSGKEKGFIAQHTEYGDLSISMTAMENMVKKCVDSHNELKVSGTRIHHARDGVVVSIRISLGNGVNIPLTVSALQKQIKQYITSCSGVDVKEVRVMVETNNNLPSAVCARPTDPLLADDTDAAIKAGELVEGLRGTAQNIKPQGDEEEPKPKKESLHQRLFKREEKPQVMPPSPTEPQADAAGPQPAGEPEAAPAEAEPLAEAKTDEPGKETTEDSAATDAPAETRAEQDEQHGEGA